MRSWIAAMLIACITALPASAADWETAARAVTADMDRTLDTVAETRKAMADERARLTAELAALKAEGTRLSADLDALKTEFESGMAEEERLTEELTTGDADIRRLADQLRIIHRDAEPLFAVGPAPTPEMGDLSARLADPDHFPGLADMKALADGFLAEIAAAGRIVRETGVFRDQTGAPRSGEILRAGRLSAYFRTDAGTGFLRWDADTGEWAEVPGRPPFGIRRTLDRYFDGESDILPVDPSGGVIPGAINRRSDLRQWLDAGGLLVWPILFIGLVAVVLSLERLYTLGRIPAVTDRIMDRFRELLSCRDWDACAVFCDRHHRIPACRVLKTGLETHGQSREVLENALEEAMLGQMPRLERFLSTLAVLAALAPLLGLLGTVTGMIHTFQGITLFGAGDPRTMSGGISEALVTTQLGLAVAIPITVVHHFFDRRVEKIVGDMEEKSTVLVTALIRESA